MDIYNSKLAKFIGWTQNESLYAITTSENTCRYSCPELLVDIKWRNHEEIHKAQYARLGWVRFITKYLIESIKNGYTNNKFEVEARNGLH